MIACGWEEKGRCERVRFEREFRWTSLIAISYNLQRLRKVNAPCEKKSNHIEHPVRIFPASSRGEQVEKPLHELLSNSFALHEEGQLSITRCITGMPILNLCSKHFAD